MSAYLHSIATAVPAYEAHEKFLQSLPDWLPETTTQKLQHVAAQSAISRRYSVLPHPLGPAGSGAFYEFGSFPTTGARMAAYRTHALPLALQAVAKLGTDLVPNEITHLIVTSCTGFYAPGLDIELVRDLGLPITCKRTLLGFMGCHAGVTGLRVAQEIVTNAPEAKVLMLNLELCSLHLQETERFDRLVSFVLFADGAAASLISARPSGLRLDRADTFLSLADADRMAWVIEDHGFAMTLDSRLPLKIKAFLERHPTALGDYQGNPEYLWAIHPGGRAILDAVQAACSIPEAAMGTSRSVLRDFGNMSSASVLFTLERLLRAPLPPEMTELNGTALAFGPGLTLETIKFAKIG